MVRYCKATSAVLVKLTPVYAEVKLAAVCVPLDTAGTALKMDV